MKRESSIDDLLHRSLQPEHSVSEPSAQFQMEIRQKMKERYDMIHNTRTTRRLCTVLLMLAVLIGVPVGALAAWQLLSPAQVANQLGDYALSQAFDSEDAVQMNETAESGGYRFTLLGLVQGAACSAYIPDEVSAAAEIHPERIYAVVAVEKADGSAMPAISSDAYQEQSLLMSPLIQGQKPWQVNIFTMGGGYGEFVQDGILYRLVEFDDLTAFADRNLWLAITDEFAISNDTFQYNEATGMVQENPKVEGVNVLFPLQLDKEKADPAKAEQLLQKWLGSSSV